MTLTYILQITAICFTCFQVNNKLFATAAAGWPCLVPPRMGKATKVAKVWKVANFPPPFQSKHLRCLLPVCSVKASRKRLHMIHVSVFVWRDACHATAGAANSFGLESVGGLRGVKGACKAASIWHGMSLRSTWQLFWGVASSRPIMESTAKRKKYIYCLWSLVCTVFFLEMWYSTTPWCWCRPQMSLRWVLM